MIPLVGYADRLSVRPGETIRFHVSNGTGAEVVPPSIVRVISADVNPAGPGIRTVAVDATVRPIAPCQPQSVAPGSYAQANLGAALEGLGSLTVVATICPTRIAGEDRPILTAFSKIGGGFGLVVAKDGSACASLAGSDGPLSGYPAAALGRWRMGRVWMTWDATARRSPWDSSHSSAASRTVKRLATSRAETLARVPASGSGRPGGWPSGRSTAHQARVCSTASPT